MLGEPEILLDELFVEGGRVQQAGGWDSEEGLFGTGGEAGVDQITPSGVKAVFLLDQHRESEHTAILACENLLYERVLR